MSGKIGKAAALLVILLLIVAGAIYALNNRKVDTPTPANVQTPTQPAIPEGCPTTPDVVDNPTQLLVVGTDTPLKMMSLGLDSEGAAQAPPPNEGHTVAWFTGGPKVGSPEGMATLSAHTYRYGGGLGNDLINGAWTEGETIIKISNDEGKSACYRYSGSKHLWVADYNPEVNGDLIYDDEGSPRFSLTVCSDYPDNGSDVTLGRMIFYGDLITG